MRIVSFPRSTRKTVGYSDARMADNPGRQEQDVWHAWREASIKFDYFITGGTGALCAFVGQTVKFERFGMNPSTLELVALLVLIASVAAGFVRIEKVIGAIGLNYLALQQGRVLAQLREGLKTFKAGANRDPLITVYGEPKSADELKALIEDTGRAVRETDVELETLMRQATVWYFVRNGTLAGGFLLLIAARVAKPYYGV